MSNYCNYYTGPRARPRARLGAAAAARGRGRRRRRAARGGATRSGATRLASLPYLQRGPRGGGLWPGALELLRLLRRADPGRSPPHRPVTAELRFSASLAFQVHASALGQRRKPRRRGCWWQSHLPGLCKVNFRFMHHPHPRQSAQPSLPGVRGFARRRGRSSGMPAAPPGRWFSGCCDLRVSL